MLASAQVGYEDGFISGFSERSQSIAKALLRMVDVYGFEGEGPLALIDIDADDAVSVKTYDDIALVRVARGEDDSYQVLFIQDPQANDAWRVDLGEAELFRSMGLDEYLKDRQERKLEDDSEEDEP